MKLIEWLKRLLRPAPEAVRIECFRCGMPHKVYPPAEFECDCGVKFTVVEPPKRE